MLDVNLPDQTGWDVLRHLRDEHAEHRPAIILATAVRPVQHRVDEFHPDAILVKPFPIVALVRLLDRLLDALTNPGHWLRFRRVRTPRREGGKKGVIRARKV